MKNVALYIINKNRNALYRLCVRSLEDSIAAKVPRFEAITPLSCAENHNYGIMQCLDYDYIAQINGDCTVISHGWLGSMFETMEIDRRIGIVGPKIIMPNDTIFSCGVGNNLRHRDYKKPDVGQYEEVEEVTSLPCNCYLYRRDALLSIGEKDWFDPKFIKSGAFVDVDLCIRLKQKRWKVFYDGRVKIMHHIPQIQGKFWEQNHLYFHKKHPWTVLRQWGVKL